MKVLKFLFVVVLGMVLGAGVCVGVYFLTVGEVAWQQYVEEKLVPNMVFIITAIGALWVTALPVISKVQATILSFNQATKDVNDTVAIGKESQININTQSRALKDFNSRFDALEEMMEKTSMRLNNTEEILRIGFCNTEELVRNGYASEIQKVGVTNEKEAS